MSISPSDEFLDLCQLPKSSGTIVMHQYNITSRNWSGGTTSLVTMMSFPQFKEILASPPVPEVINHIVQMSGSFAEVRWIDFKFIVIDVFSIAKIVR